MQVLRRSVGDTFDAGLIDGPRGKGTLVEIGEAALHLSFWWEKEPEPLAPIRLIVGLPRPQTARDLLREGASLGVIRMDFVRTDKAEASYAQSSLWNNHEWGKHLTAGAAQAFSTRLPELQHGHTLPAALAALPKDCCGIALDNYEAAEPLASLTLPSASSVALALGAERGWSANERAALRAHGFLFAHLGPRVLRTETACIAAVTLLKAKLGCA